MGGEEAVDESDLIANEKAERETQHARTDDQSAIQPGEFVSREGKGQRDHGGDQHHSRDSADSEDQKIENGPLGIVNRAQDEECDGGGACEAVDQADEERAKRVEEAELG